MPASLRRFLPRLTLLAALASAPTLLPAQSVPAGWEPLIAGPSVNQFLDALASQNESTRREAAFYLLAVADISEGTGWCGYQDFTTVTVREWVYSDLSRQRETLGEQRAAPQIRDALAARFPCKAAQAQ